MTIRSSDVIAPSRYWLAVIAVMGVVPVVIVWISCWDSLPHDRKRPTRSRNTLRAIARLCIRCLTPKVESGQDRNLISKEDSNTRAQPNAVVRCSQRHDQLLQYVDQPGCRLQHGQAPRQFFLPVDVVEQLQCALVTRMPLCGIAQRTQASR